MNANPLRHGAYLCLRGTPRELADAGIPALAERVGLRNEFESAGGDPPDAIAFLRRVSSTPGAVADEELARADAIVHVASTSAERVDAFCASASSLFRTAPRVLRGAAGARTYTSNAMHEYAYAGQVKQRAGSSMPNAFLLPMSKTAEWWAKDWMERHTYFLPRYDDAGRMLTQGHALAAAAGIPCLVRRTYRCEAQAYEFVNYFECSDDDVPTFHAVCAALRDVAKNPEWKFVREGPTWHGRRVATWTDLFS